jgi:2-polyprenyl-6-methoxyphenol hydroxylase-like FAD-dependent oxidoreductase
MQIPMTKVNNTKKSRALIIGGSLGGLFAGSLVNKIGWDVDIFERSPHDLDSRGGGIVLQPEVVKVFRRAGVDLRKVDLGGPRTAPCCSQTGRSSRSTTRRKPRLPGR